MTLGPGCGEGLCDCWPWSWAVPRAPAGGSIGDGDGERKASAGEAAAQHGLLRITESPEQVAPRDVDRAPPPLVPIPSATFPQPTMSPPSPSLSDSLTDSWASEASGRSASPSPAPGDMSSGHVTAYPPPHADAVLLGAAAGGRSSRAVSVAVSHTVALSAGAGAGGGTSESTKGDGGRGPARGGVRRGMTKRQLLHRHAFVLSDAEHPAPALLSQLLRENVEIGLGPWTPGDVNYAMSMMTSNKRVPRLPARVGRLVTDIAFLEEARELLQWAGGAYWHLKKHLNKRTAKLEVLARNKVAKPWDPRYKVALDLPAGRIIWTIRGTMSMEDVHTDLLVVPETYKGHAVHGGMMKAARNLVLVVAPTLTRVLDRYPHLAIIVTGHSLGAGTAALLTLLLRDEGFPAEGWVFACPAVASLALAEAADTKRALKSFIFFDDIVPRLSAAHVEDLRLEIRRHLMCKPWSHVLGPFAKTVAALPPAIATETLELPKTASNLLRILLNQVPSASASASASSVSTPNPNPEWSPSASACSDDAADESHAGAHASKGKANGRLSWSTWHEVMDTLSGKRVSAGKGARGGTGGPSSPTPTPTEIGAGRYSAGGTGGGGGGCGGGSSSTAPNGGQDLAAAHGRGQAVGVGVGGSADRVDGRWKALPAAAAPAGALAPAPAAAGTNMLAPRHHLQGPSAGAGGGGAPMGESSDGQPELGLTMAGAEAEVVAEAVAAAVIGIAAGTGPSDGDAPSGGCIPASVPFFGRVHPEHKLNQQSVFLEKLYPPGNLHLMTVARARVSPVGPAYLMHAMFAEVPHKEFETLPMTSSMFVNHLPERYMDAIDELVHNARKAASKP